LEDIITKLVSWPAGYGAFGALVGPLTYCGASELEYPDEPDDGLTSSFLPRTTAFCPLSAAAAAAGGSAKLKRTSISEGLLVASEGFSLDLLTKPDDSKGAGVVGDTGGLISFLSLVG